MISSALTANTRRALRVSAGKTLAEVAKEIGVTETAFFAWDHYGVTPRKGEHRIAYDALLRDWALQLAAEIERARGRAEGVQS
jgi:hypothetical protein